ncbi:MAG TPA: Hsp20/alpha crystallin family protein [Anaerolineales bacterium]|jgi:HSP20 family protein|nr:Hsp20/alpha crystallin family protein [Anaerolineales bacterium]
MTFYLQTYPYRRMARCWAENRDQTLGINIREEEDAYVLSALVPGIKSDALNIQVLEDVVYIEGEYKLDESKYLIREIPGGSFTRTLRLPAPIDAENVEAEVIDGVLTLRLPKAESARPRQIKIQSR